MKVTLYAAQDEEVTMPELTENESQQVTVAVLKFFKGFLDQQPWKSIGYVSGRCENVLLRAKAVTISDVKYLLVRAQSNHGVPGAGRLVQSECQRLLNEAQA